MTIFWWTVACTGATLLLLAGIAGIVVAGGERFNRPSVARRLREAAEREGRTEEPVTVEV